MPVAVSCFWKPIGKIVINHFNDNKKDSNLNVINCYEKLNFNVEVPYEIVWYRYKNGFNNLPSETYMQITSKDGK